MNSSCLLPNAQSKEPAEHTLPSAPGGRYTLGRALLILHKGVISSDWAMPLRQTVEAGEAALRAAPLCRRASAPKPRRR